MFNCANDSTLLKAKLPASWFLIGKSIDVPRNTIKEFQLNHRTIILFRQANGELAALEGKCPHLGARLSKGKIENDEVVCPFHAWTFNGQGKCTLVPSAPGLPGRNVRSYSVHEQWGRIFIASGTKPPYPFPVFDKKIDHQFMSGGDFHFDLKANWEVIAANGFDCDHLQFVHGRTPLTPAKVEETHPMGLKITHHYRINKTKLILDKLLHRFTTGVVTMEYEVHGGNLIFITTNFGFFKNHLVVSINPAIGGSQAKLLCLTPRSNGLFLWPTKMKLWFLGKAARKFFKGEAEELGDTNFQTSYLYDTDTSLKKFYEWLEKICKPKD